MDPTLTLLREQIDATNLRLLELLNERLELVGKIREVKDRTSSQLYSPEREARMFRNLLRGQILIWFVYSTVIAATAVAVIRP